MARAVWHGYNVWLLDTDSYLYSDPYKYLKQPPFADIPFMSLRDGGNIVNGAPAGATLCIPSAGWSPPVVVAQATSPAAKHAEPAVVASHIQSLLGFAASTN
jgi:hypothetical protein